MSYGEWKWGEERGSRGGRASQGYQSAACHSKVLLTSIVICIRSAPVSRTASQARVPCRAGWITFGAKAATLHPSCSSASTQRYMRSRTITYCGWSFAWRILLPRRTAPPLAAAAPAQPARCHRPAQRRFRCGFEASSAAPAPGARRARIQRRTCRTQPARFAPHLAYPLRRFRVLPIAGAAHTEAKTLLQLQPQRRALTNLLRLACAIVHSAEAAGFVPGDCLTRCPAWHRQYRSCMQQYQLQWRSDAWYGGDPHA